MYCHCCILDKPFTHFLYFLSGSSEIAAISFCEYPRENMLKTVLRSFSLACLLISFSSLSSFLSALLLSLHLHTFALRHPMPYTYPSPPQPLHQQIHIAPVISPEAIWFLDLAFVFLRYSLLRIFSIRLLRLCFISWKISFHSV